MTFLAYTQRLKPALDEALGEWLRSIASDLPPHLQPVLPNALADGKRLRAALLCLVSQALGGSLTTALPRAVTIECIHAASLIHDDYVDGDTMRRKRPATWTIEGARKAVLLGDLLFATAIEGMMTLSTEDGRVIARTIATVAKGAYQEPTAGKDLLASDAAYERIIFLKTGALFAAAAELGAIAASATSELRRAAHAFGSRLGEAYQIADDLHDLAAMGDATVARLPPALTPAVLRFAPQARSAVRRKGGHLDLNDLLPSMCMQMQQVLETRSAAARDALAPFPPNAWLTLLQAATEEITGGANSDTPPLPAEGSR